VDIVLACFFEVYEWCREINRVEETRFFGAQDALEINLEIATHDAGRFRFPGHPRFRGNRNVRSPARASRDLLLRYLLLVLRL
jgi:hypothetical protein